MKKKTCMLMMGCLAMVLLAAEGLAQRGLKWKGSGGWGPGNQYGMMYKVDTIETVKGEVKNIETFVPRPKMSTGVHIMLKTDKETIPVHLGPAWFVENQDVTIEPKDKVEVKGSRITFEGKPAIIAMQVAKGDKVMKLRDKDGFPAWAAWKGLIRYAP